MNWFTDIFLSLFVGFFLGGIFFYSLHWTIKHGLSSKRPWLVFFLSFLIRTGLVLLGFYLISRGDYRRLILCMVGFTLARIFVKKQGEKSDAS